MGQFQKYRRGLKPSSPTFDFMTRKLVGIPERDTEAEREEKRRLVQEWLERKGEKG